MFDRFTDRARKAMISARRSAIRLRHDSVDAAHILLGIAEDQTRNCSALAMLEYIGVTRDALRKEIERHLPAGDRAMAEGRLPLAPHGRRLLECAFEEARVLGHDFIDTEHLLLGAMRLMAPPIPEVMQALGLDLARMRNVVVEFLGEPLRGEFVSAWDKLGPLVRTRMPGTATVFGAADRLLFEVVVPALRELGCTEVNVQNIATRSPRDLRSLRSLSLRAEFVVVALIQKPAEASYAVGLCHGLMCEPILVADRASPLPDRAELPVFVVDGEEFDAVAARAAFVDFLRRLRDARSKTAGI